MEISAQLVEYLVNNGEVGITKLCCGTNMQYSLGKKYLQLLVDRKLVYCNDEAVYGATGAGLEFLHSFQQLTHVLYG